VSALSAGFLRNFGRVTRESKGTTSTRLRVLIADDTAAIRQSMSNLISGVDNVEIVGLAQNGAEALEVIRTLKPDVVTLDIRMPKLNGIEVLEAIRREKLAVTVIIMTGLEETEYRRRCLALGAHYYFHKTTEFEQVVKVVQERAALLAKVPESQATL
jgi:YesN/AraC family two-component response regulator